MKTLSWSMSLTVSLLAGCGKETMPTSVSEFMENPRLREATMVRCTENISRLTYEAECVNARDAENRVQGTAEKARREALERESALKRQALRAAQDAETEARRDAAEEEQRRLDAEYHSQFENLPQEITLRDEPAVESAEDN
jgi:uncharacterized protein YaiL (DUF2058 family)